ncbi:MAG TPA: M13 family metallopeptidase [Pyrinomonadaceae bacterium]|jgi:endothelin-converting enzyme/putative endopeptidase
MSLVRVLLVVLVLSATVLAQNSNGRGIEVSDLNRGVAACDDFFEFANGGWRAANPIPASMPRWSRRWAAGESTKEKLREILEAAAAAGNNRKGSVEQLTGDFYSACMNEARANRLGARPVAPLLAEIDRIGSRAGVERMIARFHSIAVPVPFALNGGSDNHNPTSVVAYVSAGGLGLPDRDYYLKPEPRFKEAREKYLEHVAKIFTLSGADAARARSAADAVFKLESQLAQASLDNVALRDPQATDHKMSFAELQKLTPDFNWTSYYRRSALSAGDLNVNEPKFLEEFNRLLAGVPLADWKNYLKWHLLNSAAPYLSDEFVQADFAFYGAYLRGAKETKPRWKRCVETTDQLLGEALGKKYVEKYFPPEAKSRMQEMVRNLSLAMEETIKGLDWMSPETKRRALEKLSTFNPKIGYPDKWKDYSRVPITRASYWDDVVAGRKFAVRDDLSTIGKPVDRGRWGMTPPTSDAYYNPLLNEIVFPAGILQPPAFSMEANDAVNYGAIGVGIGHEISHGFDDSGAQYDAEGRLKNWWTDDDLKKFQTRTECVVSQFENYFVEPGLHHNGRLVLGESIGDLAGAKIAYRALQLSRRGKPPLPTVDGFTPEQQFFISWGQFRGDAVRPEFARVMVQGDPHPVAKYRVIGPLSNMPEFRQAFQCREGSPMVRPREQRCEVW